MFGSSRCSSVKFNDKSSLTGVSKLISSSETEVSSIKSTGVSSTTSTGVSSIIPAAVSSTTSTGVSSIISAAVSSRIGVSSTIVESSIASTTGSASTSVVSISLVIEIVSSSGSSTISIPKFSAVSNLGSACSSSLREADVIIFESSSVESAIVSSVSSLPKNPPSSLFSIIPKSSSVSCDSGSLFFISLRFDLSELISSLRFERSATICCKRDISTAAVPGAGVVFSCSIPVLSDTSESVFLISFTNGAETVLSFSTVKS